MTEEEIFKLLKDNVRIDQSVAIGGMGFSTVLSDDGYRAIAHALAGKINTAAISMEQYEQYRKAIDRIRELKEALKNIHGMWFGDNANIHQYRMAVQDVANQALENGHDTPDNMSDKV